MDQICKYFVRSYIPENSFYDTFIPFLKIGHIENQGAAFGSFLGMRLCLVLFSVVALFIMIYFIFKKGINNKKYSIAISCVIGGAVSNLFDRIVYGSVTDYLKLTFFDPVCNLGDYCICLGAFAFIILILKNEKIHK